MKSKYLIFALIVAVLAPALLMSAVQAQTTYYAQTVAWYEEYGYFADVIDPNNGRYAHDNSYAKMIVYKAQGHPANPMARIVYGLSGTARDTVNVHAYVPSTWMSAQHFYIYVSYYSDSGWVQVYSGILAPEYHGTISVNHNSDFRYIMVVNYDDFLDSSTQEVWIDCVWGTH